jgi:hypothetical protein
VCKQVKPRNDKYFAMHIQFSKRDTQLGSLVGSCLDDCFSGGATAQVVRDPSFRVVRHVSRLRHGANIRQQFFRDAVAQQLSPRNNAGFVFKHC